MRTFLIQGFWYHKPTDREYVYHYVVVANDNQDPLEVLNEKYDLSGLTYRRGQILDISEPEAFNLSCFSCLLPGEYPIAIRDKDCKLMEEKGWDWIKNNRNNV